MAFRSNDESEAGEGVSLVRSAFSTFCNGVGEFGIVPGGTTDGSTGVLNGPLCLAGWGTATGEE
jgi:hypothetical protein